MGVLDDYQKNAGHLSKIELIICTNEKLKKLISPPTIEGLINFLSTDGYKKITNEETKKHLDLLRNLLDTKICLEIIDEINQEIVFCDDKDLLNFWDVGASTNAVKTFFYGSDEYQKTDLRMKIRVLFDMLKRKNSVDRNVPRSPILTELLRGCPEWIKEVAVLMADNSLNASKGGKGKYKKTDEAKENIKEEYDELPKDYFKKRGNTKIFICEMQKKYGFEKTDESKESFSDEAVKKYVYELKRN